MLNDLLEDEEPDFNQVLALEGAPQPHSRASLPIHAERQTMALHI